MLQKEPLAEWKRAGKSTMGASPLYVKMKANKSQLGKAHGENSLCIVWERCGDIDSAGHKLLFYLVTFGEMPLFERWP